MSSSWREYVLHLPKDCVLKGLKLKQQLDIFDSQIAKVKKKKNRSAKNVLTTQSHDTQSNIYLHEYDGQINYSGN